MNDFGLSQGLSQEVEVVQKLSLEQRKGYLLEMRIALTGFRSGKKIDLSERCPKCKRPLKPIEVMEGFNNDPLDFNTTCPDCGQRWQPEIHVASLENKRKVRYMLYCPTQTLHAIKQYAKKTPNEIETEDPALYQSAVLHFGSINDAMKEAGVDYQLKEKLDWKTKLLPVLGKVPDVIFARYAGVSPSTVSRYRRTLGIKRFTNQEIYY